MKFMSGRSFQSIYRHGFVRVAACTIRTSIANPLANAQAIEDMLQRLQPRSVGLALFPELAISGYAIDDLLLQDSLLEAVERAIDRLVAASERFMPLILVGAPLRWRARLYNCAIAIHRGRLLGVVPKIHLPNYREIYEHRHFASGSGAEGEHITVGLQTAPF